MTRNDWPPAAQTHPTRPARRPSLSTWRTRVMGGLIVGGLLIGAALSADYFTRTRVTFEVNGARYRLRTHAHTVQAALDAAGVVLVPPDAVWPPPEATLDARQVITVRKAHVVTLISDGRLQYVRTLETHPAAILAEQGLTLGPHDVLMVDGEPYTANTLSAHSWDAAPKTLQVIPSVPITVQDGERTLTLYTTAPDVARALEDAGLKLYLADRVTPPMDTPTYAEMRITVERAVPVTVIADGRELQTRARGATVADALAMVGVVPLGLDYTVPPLDAPLEAGMTIRVVRVTEHLVTQEETIPFLALRSPNGASEIMGKRHVPAGVIGVRTRVWCVRYEDGKEVKREVWGEWFSYAPSRTTSCGE